MDVQLVIILTKVLKNVKNVIQFVLLVKGMVMIFALHVLQVIT